MNKYAMFKYASLAAGILLGLGDPARVASGYENAYSTVVRRLCWVLFALGLSQLVAHLGGAILYWRNEPPPAGAGTKARRLYQALTNLRARLTRDQVICACLLVPVVLLTLFVAMDTFQPLSAILSTSLVVHQILAIVGVPLATAIANVINAGDMHAIMRMCETDLDKMMKPLLDIDDNDG